MTKTSSHSVVKQTLVDKPTYVRFCFRFLFIFTFLWLWFKIIKRLQYAFASNSELVRLELFRSYCLPFLLYAVESTGPSRKAVRMLNRCIDSSVMKIFKLTSFENTSFIRMCVGLSDVGIVIKNRFLNFISKLQAQHFFLICWICAFVNCDWQSDCDWCSDFILFSLLRVFFSCSFRW